MTIKTKFSKNDKVEFFCDDYAQGMEGVVMEVNATISDEKSEIWYRIKGPMVKSSDEYIIQESDIAKKV